MSLVDRIIERRNTLLSENKEVVPECYQGVSKEKIRNVLNIIDRSTNDMIDAVFALLDDEPTWFSNKAVRAGIKFCDGATTAHIGAHIGILQRGGYTKLDREGRDYWLKPLWEIGALEKVMLDSNTMVFVPGHPIAKSPLCAYKISEDFKSILNSPNGVWESLAKGWISEENKRQRLNFQAEMIQKAKESVHSPHSKLIADSCQYYVPMFLKGYEIIFIDDGDGDRITDEQRDKLIYAGLTLQLKDSMPDILLWNRQNDSLWVIEAVTSDGEVDIHKVNNMTAFAKRNGKGDVGFTTTYQTWKKTAERQQKYKNIAHGTYIWIQEDPSKNLYVCD
ncbi:methyltransferase-endonuclease [Yersinia enterocolitica]|uniref:BsuBI/PstI family type II restriction endonuclease n=1 Tax=Yersinia enterocolitica TaxID=630 RepID=UPI0005DAE9BC|nr:BsuBI/PstI family type II restriction endonuclease [Yersinia enterocolitica]CNG20460.1 methyltransferase-endonuclease [Yersinia enterocolitica]